MKRVKHFRPSKVVHPSRPGQMVMILSHNAQVLPAYMDPEKVYEVKSVSESGAMIVLRNIGEQQWSSNLWGVVYSDRLQMKHTQLAEHVDVVIPGFKPYIAESHKQQGKTWDELVKDPKQALEDLNSKFGIGRLRFRVKAPTRETK